MDTSESIKELLHDNDCVIVPGLGGFVANYKPATVGGQAHVSFCPPAKDILFNSKISHNDGLLVDYISTSKGISFAEAREEVSVFVIEVKKKLRNSKMATIQHVGTLSTNKEGKIEFEPSMDDNLLLDAFGLSSFTLPVLQNATAAKRITSFKDKESVRRLAYRKYARRVLIAAPVVLLLATIPTIYITNTQESSLFPRTSKPAVEAREIPAVKQGNPSPVEKAIDEKTEKKNALAYVEPTTKYHLIVGCFKSVASAQKTKEVLKGYGYMPQVIEQAGLFKVSAAEEVDNAIARGKLDKIKALPSFSDAWIMKSNE